MPLEDPSVAHFIPNCLYAPWTLGTAHGSFHLETLMPDMLCSQHDACHRRDGTRSGCVCVCPGPGRQPTSKSPRSLCRIVSVFRTQIYCRPGICPYWIILACIHHCY